MTDPSAPPPKPFPIAATALGSFAFGMSDIRAYFRAGRISILLYFAANIALSAVWYFSEDPEEPSGKLLSLLVVELAALASTALIVPASTAWIRLTVFGKQEDGRFRFGSPEWLYLFYYILIMVVMTMIAISLVLLLKNAVPSLPDTVSFLLAALVAVYLAARILPVFGSAACGEPASLNEIWALTRPHGGRIAAATGLFFFVLAIVGVCLMAVLGPVADWFANNKEVMTGPSSPETIADIFFQEVGSGHFASTIATTVVSIITTLFTAVFFGRVYAALTTDKR